MCSLSFAVLFQAANMVPNGVLLREKQFVAIGGRIIVSSLVAGTVAIVMAVAGFGVYALIANNVLQVLINFVWNAVGTGMRTRVSGIRLALKRVGNFSVFQFLSQLVQYLARNVDNFAIGIILGSNALGYYSNAYKLAKYPIDVVPNTLNPVLRTFYGSMKDDKKTFYQTYLSVEKVLSLVGVFLSVFCFFASKELVLLFFGSSWTASVPLFRALSVSIVFQMVNFTFGSVLEATRQTRSLFRSTLVSTTIIVILLGIGLWTKNLAITSILISLGLILYTLPVLYYVVHVAFQKSIIEHLSHFKFELLSSSILSMLYAVLWNFFPDNLIASFAMKLVLGAITYIVLLKLGGQMRYLKMLLPSKKSNAH